MGCCPDSTARPSRGVLSAFYRLQPVGVGGGGGGYYLYVPSKYRMKSGSRDRSIKTSHIEESLLHNLDYNSNHYSVVVLPPHFYLGRGINGGGERGSSTNHPKTQKFWSGTPPPRHAEPKDTMFNTLRLLLARNINCTAAFLSL